MSRPPYSVSGRFRSPLGQRLQGLRYRRQWQQIERLDNDLKQLKTRREREQLILSRFFTRPM